MDLLTIFGVGGPAVVILAIVSFVVKEWRQSSTNRRLAPRIAAESDSAVVAATKDVVVLIRSELAEVITSRKYWQDEAKRLQTENEHLQNENDRMDERNRQLQITISRLRFPDVNIDTPEILPTPDDHSNPDNGDVNGND